MELVELIQFCSEFLRFSAQGKHLVRKDIDQ